MQTSIKTFLKLSAAFMLFFFTLSFAGGPQGNISVSTAIPEYAPGEVLVRFTNQSEVSSIPLFDRLKALLGENTFTKKSFHHFPVMFLKSNQYTTEELINKMQTLSNVESVEPNYVRHIMGTPNDTLYDNLWGLNNTGQDHGTVDADIDAPEAWELQTGSHSVVVAVVDTGIDYTHPDLQANMWDGRDYNIPHHGWDFASDASGNDDNDPKPDEGNDHLLHGTHVAGTIGATANNRRGVVGVSQQVSLLAVKVFRPNGYGYDSDILEGMDFISNLIDQGVNIVAINASYGGGGYSQTMKDTIQDLGNKGVVFCAAAGNATNDNDDTPSYPASYNVDNIIAVAATDRNDQLASFSSYGATSVDIAAPGVAITSTVPGNRYATWNGTSMATPHVAGAVALLAANTPTSSVSERINTLLSSVDVIPSLDGKVATGGRLNINNALILDNNGETPEPTPTPEPSDVTTWTTGHYSNNTDVSQVLSIANASSLTVTVSGETERRYDYLYIYDENGDQVARFDGNINETLTVQGSSITARLVSDGSITKSGVTVTISSNGGTPSPTPTATPSPTPTPDPDDVTTWTTGHYGNNTDISQVLSIGGATSLTVTVHGETERRYDYLYIYDENGDQVARFDGRINETISLQGSSITARLVSDYSVTKSGVTVSITTP